MPSYAEEEVEVLRLHMQGLSDDAIARRTGVSRSTVRRRAARIRERCGARTRAEAIALLTAAGVLAVSTSSHEDPRAPHRNPAPPTGDAR